MPNYRVTYNTQGQWLTPPAKRRPKLLSFLYALLAPLQWLHDNFFDERIKDGVRTGGYVLGNLVDPWNNAINYLKGQRVMGLDNFSVWEALQDNTNIDPLSPTQTSWLKVLDDWVGLNERTVYTSQVLELEYILNNRFYPLYNLEFINWNFDNTTNWTRVSPYSDIYITPLNGTYFTIYETAIGSTIFSYADPSVIPIYDSASFPLNFGKFQINVKNSILTAVGEKAIRAIADKYVIAGVQYTVVGY